MRRVPCTDGLYGWRWKMKPYNCQCAEYPFPHRPGGGRCDDPGERPASCDDCPHGYPLADPYLTGDRWYKIIECGLGHCPWGAG